MTNPYSTKQVLIKVSDPWDLGIQINWQPFSASIVSGSDDTDTVLLRLDRPFTFKGITCEYFIASPRLEGFHMSNLDSGKEVFCGMTRITEEQAKSETPMDLSRWRGGLGIVGGLEPLR